MPRLGSAIATTILSLFSAVSLVGVDKAQAAVLTYNLDAGTSTSPPNRGISYFKVDNSSLTGIGAEYIPVSEGRLYGYTLEGHQTYGYTLAGGKEYNDLAGLSTLFWRGEFIGLQASGGDSVSDTFISPPDEPGPPSYLEFSRSISWSILGPSLSGYYDSYWAYNGGPWQRWQRYSFGDTVSYTLVKTETVPEPLTAGGTALALAGLSWLKHKKKMAA
jgi:hypothetical protein